MTLSPAIHADRPFVYLPKLVPIEQAREFEFETRSLPSRRVICGEEAVSWDEQTIPSGSSVFVYFNSPQVLELVQSAADAENTLDPSRTMCWVSRYRTGEHIGRHRDSAGTVQLLVCLIAPPAGSGGLLILNAIPERVFRLNEGDGLLFRANQIEHYTTQLVRTNQCPNPLRVVAVARYFSNQVS